MQEEENKNIEENIEVPEEEKTSKVGIVIRYIILLALVFLGSTVLMCLLFFLLFM